MAVDNCRMKIPEVTMSAETRERGTTVTGESALAKAGVRGLT